MTVPEECCIAFLSHLTKRKKEEKKKEKTSNEKLLHWKDIYEDWVFGTVIERSAPSVTVAGF